MEPISLQDLQAVAPKTNSIRLGLFLDPLNMTFMEFSIDSTGRQAAFLAQVAHESNRFLWLREIWGPTPAQRAYEPPSRKAEDLGNTNAGDGFLYRGRGLIQITGRANYRDCGAGLDLPLEDHPELLEDPLQATRSAGWYWDKHHLNVLADAGDFEKITRRINGGLNGQPERLALWEAAKEVLA